MRRLLLSGVGAAILGFGFAEAAAADEAGYRGKRVRAASVAKVRGAVVRRAYQPYIGYWRPPQPEPPSGPPGVATVYAYPYFVGPTPPYVYPSFYAGYARHTPGYQYGIPRCECGAGYATPGLAVLAY
jgi:hypothetical protein